jgi:hypothetical protein
MDIQPVEQGLDTPEPVSNEQTGDVGSQNSQEGQQQDTSQNWNPQEWALQFKGQQIYPKDRQHLVNLAQKGYSYETSMEQVNQERERIARLQGEYKRYEQLDEALKTNPGFAQQLWGYINNLQNQNKDQQNQESELPPQFQQVQSELEELKSWKNQYAEQQASQAIDNELSQLASKYSQYDWQSDDGTGSLAYKVLKHAHDNNILNLNSAFRDLMFDQSQQQTKLNTLKQQKEQTQKLHREGVVQSSGASTSQPMKKSGYSSQDTYGDLAQKALASLGG